MRAVIYTRVSSDQYGTGRSVDQQEAECRQICERNGWTVVHVFTDNDRSASRRARKGRPGYEQLKQFIGTGGADVLVLWESSRGTRRLDVFVELRDLCELRGALICCKGRTYDMSRADDRRDLGRDAIDDEHSSEQTRERVLRGVRANMATGKPYGRLPYGYRRVYDDRGLFVEQVPHEEQAAVVREAGRRILAGDSCRNIASDLTARAIPAPEGGSWDAVQIKRLVIRPVCAGLKVHRGQIVGPGDWPAILDEQTYTGCVARLSDPRRKTMRDGSVKHLLSGAGRCGACGGQLRVQKNRSHYAYLCRQAFCVSMKTSTLERFITNVIVARLSQPDAIDLICSPASDDLVAAARIERDELTARLETFYAQAADGKLSDTGLANIEARLLPQIESAAARARPVPVPQVLRDLIGDQVADRICERWELLPVAARREVVSILMEVRLHPTTRGTKLYEQMSEEGANVHIDDVELAELWSKRVEIIWKTA